MKKLTKQQIAKMACGMLSGLPGVSARSIDCIGVSTRSRMKRLIRQGAPSIAAGKSGAISVWIRDDGEYAAELCRFGVTTARHQSKTLAGIDRWIDEMWSKMGRQDVLAAKGGAK